MNIYLRNGTIDVAIVMSPGLIQWPSPGAKEVLQYCSEAGLSTALYSYAGLKVRGVVPYAVSGGCVVLEDSQSRIHQIQARAVVRFSEVATFPDPFEGWTNRGVVPFQTARTLLASGMLQYFFPAVAILGTGNKAIRFACDLLESGVTEVYCIEVTTGFGRKPVYAWEVNFRRFEMLGGRIVQGNLKSFRNESSHLWELKVEDAIGTRVLMVSKLVTCGPFHLSQGYREYPQGSLLFEVDQTALEKKASDPEGWTSEIERSQLVAARIVRSLNDVTLDSDRRVSRKIRAAKNKIKSESNHLLHPHLWEFQQKWLGDRSRVDLEQSPGIPKKLIDSPKAWAECFEDIECKICQDICPEQALQITRNERGAESFLIEDKCTGCGDCVKSCPSQSIRLVSLLRETDGSCRVRFFVSARELIRLRSFPPQQVKLINRKGDVLTVTKVVRAQNDGQNSWLEVEVLAHLVYEVGGVQFLERDRILIEDLDHGFYSKFGERIEVQFLGHTRMLQKELNLALSLFELGYERSEDILLCPDGSCQRCEIWVDGEKQLACQTVVRPQMSIQWSQKKEVALPKTSAETEIYLCPCLKVKRETILDLLSQGQFQSLEAVLSLIQVGKGRCHGRLCMGALKRLYAMTGFQADHWVDWRFPWSEWVFTSAKRGG